MARISVIVTNYNYARFIGECLSSIKAQTFTDFELIVVDDASTDGSVGVIRQHQPDKLLVNLSNLGTRRASNLGVALAEGEFAVLINADDWVDPTFLQECFSVLSTTVSDVAFAYTNFHHFGKSQDQTFDSDVEFPEWNIDTLKRYNFVLASAMFRVSVFREVGGFCVDYGMEDYDLWLRMGLRGYRGQKVHGFLYHYRAHESNRTLSLDVGAAMEKIKERNGVLSPIPKFSLCYASRRGNLIKEKVSLWRDRSVNPSEIEVIVAVDSDDKESLAASDSPDVIQVVQYVEPFDCVKAWNLAAKRSRGSVIIAISDDFIPPERWDESLLAISNGSWVDDDKVIRTSDGDLNSNLLPEKERPITLPIITRKRYSRFGYIFFPEYASMYCDQEMADVAIQEVAVIDATHLVFEHVHPLFGKRDYDDVDRTHSSDSRWDYGRAIYLRRKAAGFKESTMVVETVPDLWQEYVRTIRDENWAISLEMSLWLESFLDGSSYRFIMDVGANFESIVMARHVNRIGGFFLMADVQREGVDANLHFMEKHQCRPTTSEIWPFEVSCSFDFIFINSGIADSDLRNRHITSWAPSILKPGGSLVLNDGHYIRVQQAREFLVECGWKAFTPPQTVDKFNRYGIILTKP